MPWLPTTPAPPPVLKVPGWYAVLILSGAGNIASAEAFGTPKVARSQAVLPTGIASLEAFGALAVRYIQAITVTGIPSLQAFGGSVLQPGAITILATGIASAEAVGTPAISAKAFIAPAGIVSAQVFGTTVISTGPVNLAPSGIAGAEAVGTPSVSYLVSPPGIVSEETFGAHALSLKIVVTGISTAEAFGTANVTGPLQAITPNGIPSAEGFGGSALQPGAVSVLAQGISSGEAVGTPALAVGAVNIAVSGIASAEAFGTNKIGMYLIPTGIPSAESVGAATITPKYSITATGIGSAEAFGTATVTRAAVPAAIVGTPTTSSTTSITLPPHQIGDFIGIIGVNNTSTTIGVPAAGGTVPVFSNIDNIAGIQVSWAKATAANHTSGTWTSATHLHAFVIRNQDSTNPIGGHAINNGTAASPSAPAVTMSKTDGTSVVLHFFSTAVLSGAAWAAAPAGYTRRSAIAANGSFSTCLNSKDVTTSDGAISQGTTINSAYRCATIEILAQ